MEQYRELSFTRSMSDGKTFEADTILVIRNGRAYRRVQSKTRPWFCTDVPVEGDPVAYEKRLMHEKRVMADYDERNRLGMVPKPVGVAPNEPCAECGGSGEAEDKHGNWKTCRACGGAG